MTGKTNGSLKRNVVNRMIELLGDEMKYTYEDGTRIIKLWGHTIYCIGANDERAEQKIRGGTFSGAYGDEITLWPESYFQMLMSRLSVAGAQLFGTTNPDNPNHWFKKNYLDDKELNIKLFHWPLEDNVFLPLDYIDNLKKEYKGLWYKRFILGEWCVAEGAVYDFFDEKIHTGSMFPEAESYYVAVDYGIGNPTSFGLYGVNRHSTPKVWRIKGYYWDSRKENRQKTDGDYSKDMKDFLGDIRPNAIIVDPSAASLKVQLTRDHGYVVKDAENDVLEGIKTTSRMLQEGQFMISRDPSNQPLIDELYGYMWDDKAAARGEDKPIKDKDHATDEMRYMIYTMFKPKRLDYKVLTKM